MVIRAQKKIKVSEVNVQAPNKPVQPVDTSFGTLVRELNNPTSTVGKLNRTKEFMEGYEWSRQGRGKGRNPYGADTFQYDEWQAGWECKYYGEAL